MLPSIAISLVMQRLCRLRLDRQQARINSACESQEIHEPDGDKETDCVLLRRHDADDIQERELDDDDRAYRQPEGGEDEKLTENLFVDVSFRAAERPAQSDLRRSPGDILPQHTDQSERYHEEKKPCNQSHRNHKG